MIQEGSVIYVATIEITGHRPYRLYLLPDHPEDRMMHQAALGWAYSIDGDLPNRYEQAILHTFQREQFDPDSYWSSALHESALDYAWFQTFALGIQYYDSRTSKLRARAVRRVFMGETK
jgi:hypothetical protein